MCCLSNVLRAGINQAAKELSHELYLLVTCLITVSTGIRVDWNTNKGPIVPPTPRTTVRPKPPYREPAPVWEDQSDDIPNPNPYVYVLPPPSRPRPATNNYLTSDRRPVTQTNYNNNNNYGSIIPANYGTDYQQQSGNIVSSLAARYIPNVGIRYYAVVPSGDIKTTKYLAASAGAEGLSNGYYFAGDAGDKQQGKYNAKTKKYKAYEKEKLKYVPINYYPLYEFALPSAQPYTPVFNQEQLLNTQQLPLLEAPQPFRAPEVPKTTTPPQTIQPTKPAHDKAAIAEKPKSTIKSAKAHDTPTSYAKFNAPNAISNGARS